MLLGEIVQRRFGQRAIRGDRQAVELAQMVPRCMVRASLRQQNGQIEMRLGVAWIELEGTLEVGFGTQRRSRHGQRHTKLIVDVRIVGPMIRHLFERAYGLVVAPCVHQALALRQRRLYVHV